MIGLASFVDWIGNKPWLSWQCARPRHKARGTRVRVPTEFRLIMFWLFHKVALNSASTSKILSRTNCADHSDNVTTMFVAEIHVSKAYVNFCTYVYAKLYQCIRLLFYLAVAAKDAGPAGLSRGRALAWLEVQVLEAGHTLEVVRRGVEVVIHRHSHGEQVCLAVAGRQVPARPRDILDLWWCLQRIAGAAAATQVAPDQRQQEEDDEGWHLKSEQQLLIADTVYHTMCHWPGWWPCTRYRWRCWTAAACPPWLCSAWSLATTNSDRTSRPPPPRFCSCSWTPSDLLWTRTIRRL